MTYAAARQFQYDAEKVLVAISECSEAMDRLMTAYPDLSDLVNQSNELGGRVTVLEPLVLQVEMQKLLAKIKDLELIADVQRLDPDRTLVGETNRSWYELAKGSLNVNAIKELRSAMLDSFKRPYFDIRDAKRVCELVKEGQI